VWVETLEGVWGRPFFFVALYAGARIETLSFFGKMIDSYPGALSTRERAFEAIWEAMEEEE
jgi:hypothetical protein